MNSKQKKIISYTLLSVLLISLILVVIWASISYFNNPSSKYTPLDILNLFMAYGSILLFGIKIGLTFYQLVKIKKGRNVNNQNKTALENKEINKKVNKKIIKEIESNLEKSKPIITLKNKLLLLGIHITNTEAYDITILMKENDDDAVIKYIYKISHVKIDIKHIK